MVSEILWYACKYQQTKGCYKSLEDGIVGAIKHKILYPFLVI